MKHMGNDFTGVQRGARHDVVEHKKKLQSDRHGEWDMSRPCETEHTANQHSKSMATTPTTKRREAKRFSS